MTLATVERYDGERVPTVGDRAVVVGASVAGLLAARVLADGFEQVTVLERDPLPEDPSARRGVPQGRHVHLLLAAGHATFEDLFPGYTEDLVSAGALVLDALSDFVHYEGGDYLAAGDERYPTYAASRPLFEHHLRQSVAAHDGVTLRSGTQCTDIRLDDGATAVEGVAVRDDDEATGIVPADLVVDATGRTSRTPELLAAAGYEPPRVEEVVVDVAYSTLVVERPPADRRLLFVPPEPPRTRGAAAFPIEDGRRLVTAFGVHGDHPPTDAAGVREFLDTLPGPDVAGLVDGNRQVTDQVAHYPFPSSRRHRYDELDAMPDDLVVLGDALCSFNPIYGQGMSVAALEALELHHALAAGGRSDLPARFYDRAAAVVDVPWSIAVGADFAFSQTEGDKPRGTDLLNRYLDRLRRKAHEDATLREALYRVFNLEERPSALFRPGVVGRVLRPTRADLHSVAAPLRRHTRDPG